MGNLSDFVQNDGGEFNPQMDFSYKLNGRTYNFNVAQELDFSLETLNDEMMNHSKVMGLLGTMYEDAKKKVSLAEANYKKEKAKLWATHKNETRTQSMKVLSDTMVDSMVQSDAPLHRILLEVEELKSTERILARLLENMRTKKELMQSFGANIRNII